MGKLIKSLRNLMDDVELYSDLLYTYPDSISVGVEMTDTSETATIHLGKKSGIEEGFHDISFKIMMTSEILEKCMKGQVDVFALAGRGHIDQVRPVSFEFIDKNRVNESLETLYAMAMYFFNPGRIKSRTLSLDFAGEAHGARPIPLVYWQGVRYAWYYVAAGQILNEDGEKDPYPQAFVVLKGRGRLEMEDHEVDTIPQRTYYIPRNCLHRVHSDEDMELMWIAWDAPMFG